MSTANNLTATKRFEVDSRDENYNVLVEKSQKNNEEEAREELDARMGPTLADFMCIPSWNMEQGEVPHMHLYTLTMKVLFKP